MARPYVLERASRELGQALRGLRRAPAFTATAVLILALGIGMATALFAATDAVLVRPLPVRAPDRLVLLRTLDPGGVDVSMTQEELKQLGSASRTLGDVAGVAHQGAFETAVTDGDRALTLRAAWVTGNFFALLGVRPALGRFFGTADEVPVGRFPGSVVLSYETWRRDFGGDPGVIGRRIGNPYTGDVARVVGVAPPGLAYPAGAEYWTPIVYPNLDVVARLAPGATPAAAHAEFFSIMRRVDAERVARKTQGAPIARAQVETFRHAVLGSVRPELLVLAAAVALLLLIACVNVGGLVLLRATAREAEVAVRRSIGAGTADILRPLVWESAALAVAGGLLGLACAVGALDALTRLAPERLPRLDVLRLSSAPLGLAAATTLVALVLAALLPALGAARGSLAAPLRMDARAGRGGGRRRRLRQALVASQVALALVMLAGAALLARSLDRLTRIPLGYQPAHLSVITIAHPIGGGDADSVFTRLYDRVAPALRTLPEVVSLTPVDALPFYGPQVFTARWAAAGQSDAAAAANPFIPFEVAGRDYFRTFGIRLLRGRGFRENEGGDAPPVVVVSHSVAERFWPGQDPIGKQLRLTWDTSANPWHTVVGEAEDIHYRSLREATPSVWVPWRGWFFQGTLAIRTRGPLAAALPALRGALRAAAPEATLARAETMDGLLGTQLALPRLSTLLLSSFGLAALLLAALGLYGAMAAAVRERTHELGIRVALGATPARLRAAVLADAGRIAAAGGAVGLAAALLASRFLRSLLFQVSPADPLALLTALALLLAVALAAAWVPAWRATRADPMAALRAE